MKLDAEIDQLARLFPSFVAVDASLAITAIGPAMERWLPSVAIGTSLFEHLELQGGQQTDSSPECFAQLSQVTLWDRAADLKLRGEVLRSGTGFFLALRPSPEQYLNASSGLQISDFAPDDPAVYGLLMFSLQHALLEEQRLVAVELVNERQKSVDLFNRISRVAGYIAHDFNNFLSIIKLNCDRLARDESKSSRSLRLIEIIKETSARGSALTRSFMTLSQQRDDTRIPISIDSLIHENMSFFSTIVGSRIAVTTSLDAGHVQVLASPVAALHCLINLLINARDAIAENGRISITTKIKRIALQTGKGIKGKPADFVAIEVADTGSGMDEDILSRAFEPLFSTKPNGNGLGLASVLEFAREADGDACIESSKGDGTRIYLYLPAVPALALADGPTVKDGDTRPVRVNEEAKGRLLLVDDEPYALEALAELLELEGYIVKPCNCAADAIAELTVGSYDVLLTDIIMPEKSGAILAREAQSMQPGIKIILMSGYVPDGEDLEDHWMFVRKPIATKSLGDLLRLSLSRGG